VRRFGDPDVDHVESHPDRRRPRVLAVHTVTIPLGVRAQMTIEASGSCSARVRPSAPTDETLPHDLPTDGGEIAHVA
jgi:hypothetical protein